MVQLFMTFNANVNEQDQDGNTALHYCMEINNWPFVDILLKYGASCDIKNNRVVLQLLYLILNSYNQIALEHYYSSKTIKDQTPIDTAYEYKNFDGADTIKTFLTESKLNKKYQDFILNIYPFFVTTFTLTILESSLSYQFKALLFTIILTSLFMTRTFFYGNRAKNRLPFTASRIYLIFGYLTYIIYFRPIVFDLSIYSSLIVILTFLSLFNVYKASVSDPGFLTTQNFSSDKNQVKC